MANDYDQHSSFTAILKNLDWPSLEHRLILMYKIVHNLVGRGNPIYNSHPSRLAHQGRSQLHLQIQDLHFVIATQKFILPSHNTPLELSWHCWELIIGHLQEPYSLLWSVVCVSAHQRDIPHFLSINQSLFAQICNKMTIVVQITPWAGQQGSQWH